MRRSLICRRALCRTSCPGCCQLHASCQSCSICTCLSPCEAAQERESVRELFLQMQGHGATLHSHSCCLLPLLKAACCHTAVRTLLQGVACCLFFRGIRPRNLWLSGTVPSAHVGRTCSPCQPPELGGVVGLGDLMGHPGRAKSSCGQGGYESSSAARVAGIRLFGLQTSWRIVAERDPVVVQQVMHPVLIGRIPCAAVRVAGERLAESAVRVAASFMPFAKAAAGALACLRVRPRKRMSQSGSCSCRCRVMARRCTRVACCLC